MNQIVISRTFTHHGKNSEASVIVIESNHSVIEFDNLFRNTLFTFSSRWQDLYDQVQQDLSACQKLEEGMAGYYDALKAFTHSFDEQFDFETKHEVFVHGNFKISMSSFIVANETCDFSVLSLVDWVSVKTAESSTGFDL